MKKLILKQTARHSWFVFSLYLFVVVVFLALSQVLLAGSWTFCPKIFKFVNSLEKEGEEEGGEGTVCLWCGITTPRKPKHQVTVYYLKTLSRQIGTNIYKI